MTNPAAANDARLQAAGDDMGYWIRHAEAGETCTLCGKVFEGGELVDTLFIAVCMDCHDEQQKRIMDKINEEQNHD